MSTRDQHPEAQTDALAAAGCEKTFTDHASGTLARRPALDAALSYLRAGDTLVVTKLDRLGRSVRNLKQIVDDLQTRQVGLRAVSQGIDTTTPGGRLFFHMLAAIAEFEVMRIPLAEGRSRTRESMALAKAKGRLRGKQPKLKPTREAQLVALWRAGNHTTLELAEMFDVARSTVYRAIQRRTRGSSRGGSDVGTRDSWVSSHVFVDESKRHGLLVAAAVVQPRDLAPARIALRRLCLPGQSRLHFTKERDDRRRQIQAAIVELDVVIDLYDATGMRDQQQARAACLRALVADLAAASAHRLVLEQDDSLVRSDQAVLYAAVRAAGAQDQLTYEHVPARSEPLLWIADAAAWSWSRGTPWPERLQPIVRHARTL